MPTYNRAHRISKAIDSILTQTYSNFEFIIINDGSDDKTLSILNDYKKKDNRIIVLNNESNQGIVYSLNKALKIAKGKYIARMDDDDISLPNRFAEQITYLEKHPDITVIGSAIQIPKSKQIKQLSSSPEESAILSHFQVPVYHPTAIIRHSFLKQHKINYTPKYDSAEDTAFWYDIIEKGGKITNLKQPLVIQDILSQKNYSLRNQNIAFDQFIKYSLEPLLQEKIHFFHFPLSSFHACIIVKKFKETNYKNLNNDNALHSLYKRYCHINFDDFFYMIQNKQKFILFHKDNIVLNKPLKGSQIKKVEKEGETYLILKHPRFSQHIIYKKEGEIYHRIKQ